MISKFLRSFLVITFLFIISNCALAANFTGDALVVFKAPEGQKVTASALSNKKSSLRASVKTAVEAVGAEVQDVYEAISEVDGSIIVYVRSTTKTTEELINEFQFFFLIILRLPANHSRTTSTRLPPLALVTRICCWMFSINSSLWLMMPTSLLLPDRLMRISMAFSMDFLSRVPKPSSINSASICTPPRLDETVSDRPSAKLREALKLSPPDRFPTGRRCPV